MTGVGENEQFQNDGATSADSAVRIKRALDALRSRDMSSAGYEARILHLRRIEQLEAKYTELAAATHSSA